jgi:hypothetical protein
MTVVTRPRATSSGAPRHKRASGREVGPDVQTEPGEGNARLTAMTAVVLFVLLAAEGVTVLRSHRLLTPHVVIGVVLVPVVWSSFAVSRGGSPATTWVMGSTVARDRPL